MYRTAATYGDYVYSSVYLVLFDDNSMVEVICNFISSCRVLRYVKKKLENKTGLAGFFWVFLNIGIISDLLEPYLLAMGPSIKYVLSN